MEEKTVVVSRKKKKRQSKSLAGNHQRSWIWGRHAVLETLRSERWIPLEIRYSPRQLSEETQQMVRTAGQLHGILLQEVDTDTLTAACHTSDHQGIIAQMPEFPYVDLSRIEASSPETCNFVLVLDRIQDPFNFGAILRSAELFGVDAVMIAEKEQVGVTTHVARSSAGAVNYLQICRVESLIRACRTLKKLGLQLIAATAGGKVQLDQVNLTVPSCLIIGNEGAGIDPDLLEVAEIQCAIPQTGQLDSLNAAVAAGVLCYEVLRQRQSARS